MSLDPVQSHYQQIFETDLAALHHAFAELSGPAVGEEAGGRFYVFQLLAQRRLASWDELATVLRIFFRSPFSVGAQDLPGGPTGAAAITDCFETIGSTGLSLLDHPRRQEAQTWISALLAKAHERKASAEVQILNATVTDATWTTENSLPLINLGLPPSAFHAPENPTWPYAYQPASPPPFEDDNLHPITPSPSHSGHPSQNHSNLTDPETASALAGPSSESATARHRTPPRGPSPSPAAHPRKARTPFSSKSKYCPRPGALSSKAGPPTQQRYKVGEAVMATFERFGAWPAIILEPDPNHWWWSKIRGVRCRDSYCVKGIPAGADWEWVPPSKVSPASSAPLAAPARWANGETPCEDDVALFHEGVSIIRDSAKFEAWKAMRLHQEHLLRRRIREREQRAQDRKAKASEKERRDTLRRRKGVEKSSEVIVIEDSEDEAEKGSEKRKNLKRRAKSEGK